VAPKKKAPPKPISLNPEQSLAVNAGGGYWCVQAGAGSGKTSVLIARYQRLLREGVAPDQILGLTFTSNAAKGMRDRAGEIDYSNCRVNGFVTFHSLCLSIAMAEREHFPYKLADFPLATEAQCNKIASDLSKKYELNFKQLRSWISLQKRNGVRPVDALKIAEKEGKNEKFALAYKAYDLRLKEALVLDFDSMTLEVVQLLSNNAEVWRRWQFEYVMCDECQDCDIQQYELLRLVSHNHRNLYMVGDGTQSIYGFRGSDSEVFLNIEDLFPTVQKMDMTKNHRSTGRIVDFLKQVNPIEDFAAKFYTDNELGVEPTITKYGSSVEEAQAVVTYVNNRAMITNVAVLTRTNRALRPIEDALSVAGVKYRLLSNSGFWTQPEVKAVCGYLQCVLFPSDYALGFVLRSGFHPTKYLKRKEVTDHIKTVQKMDKEKTAWSIINQYRPPDSNLVKALGTLTSFIHSLQRYRDQPPQQALQSIIQSLHAYDTLDEDAIDNSPTENIQELVRMAGRFSTIKDFISFTMKASQASKSRTGVILGTIHAAKGAEFHTVFLPSVSDGILPHSKAENMSEEANIWFVACSRAEKELYISYTGIPSPFLSKFIKKPEPESIDEVFA
jgi:DNA helicase II / ATP-dependent DNA helicase PcrA